MNESCRILVADDSVVSLTFVKRLLAHSGYQVDTVGNGAEVIRALENTRYDLVIMDCLMPVMDGLTATRIIRDSSPARFDPHIPIIASTALASARDRENCFEAGVTDYISKPVDAESLLEMVRSCLDAGIEIEGEQLSSSSGRVSPPDEEAQSRFQKELLNSMSERIAGDAELWRHELRAHQDAGEFDKLGMLAHKIRGTAGILGRQRLSEFAENLEVSAGKADQERSGTLTTQLIRELRRLIIEVRQDR